LDLRSDGEIRFGGPSEGVVGGERDAREREKKNPSRTRGGGDQREKVIFFLKKKS
jgi:hypothetical protein